MSAPAVVTRIQSIVAQAYGFSHRDSLLLRSRDSKLRVPRQVACYLCRKHTPCTLPELGRAFRQHHTSVLHSIERIALLMGQDPEFAQAIGKIETAIRDHAETPSLIVLKREKQPEWARRLEAKIDAFMSERASKSA